METNFVNEASVISSFPNLPEDTNFVNETSPINPEENVFKILESKVEESYFKFEEKEKLFNTVSLISEVFI